jgi:8-oxo-dGTP pyrophosphatase MutT (NUDIX family)
MSLKLDLTVAAIAEERGRFLFVQERVARRVVLNQPAGHLEPGESFIDAVVRETREETGREFIPDCVTGLYLWQGPAGRTVLRVAFSGRVGERAAGAILDRAIIRTLWLDRDQLAARAAEHRSPLVLLSVDDYRRGARHSLELLHHVPLGDLPVRQATG